MNLLEELKNQVSIIGIQQGIDSESGQVRLEVAEYEKKNFLTKWLHRAFIDRGILNKVTAIKCTTIIQAINDIDNTYAQGMKDLATLVFEEDGNTLRQELSLTYARTKQELEEKQNAAVSSLDKEISALTTHLETAIRLNNTAFLGNRGNVEGLSKAKTANSTALKSVIEKFKGEINNKIVVPFQRASLNFSSIFNANKTSPVDRIKANPGNNAKIEKIKMLKNELAEIDNFEEENENNHLCCPFSQGVMADPVVWTADGHTYERAELINYINTAIKHGDNVVALPFDVNHNKVSLADAKKMIVTPNIKLQDEIILKLTAYKESVKDQEKKSESPLLISELEKRRLAYNQTAAANQSDNEEEGFSMVI